MHAIYVSQTLALMEICWESLEERFLTIVDSFNHHEEKHALRGDKFTGLHNV